MSCKLALVFTLLCATSSLAQTPAVMLSGVVTDASGLPLPGVSVQAISADRRSTAVIVTSDGGQYQFTQLPAGRYIVMWSLTNFADVRRTNVLVSHTAPAVVNVTLQLSLNASVVVTARDSFRNLAELSRPSENLVGVASAASEGAVTGRQIASRPIMRPAEVLEAVPGVISSQHSGEGKANQYYLRGFNLDHGTDFSTTVAGVPVNLPTHAHGQGYSDLNFLIPELVTGVQFRKGPYYAQSGDFSAAGAANISYASVLGQPTVSASMGQHGWGRVFAAASPRVAGGHLLAALEVNRNDGPWQRPDDYHKVNGVLRYSRGTSLNAWSLTALSYDARWNATDQIPQRAVDDGRLDRFGLIDESAGGLTARHSLVAELLRTGDRSMTRATAYVSRYRLNLFSNFTYALDDPINGDQFEQADRRWTTGGSVSHTRRLRLGGILGEYTMGVQARRDDIPLVGLYRTARRARLSTTREDDVTQSAAAVFGEGDLRLSPWLRTSAGLRVDRSAARVASDDDANSGRSRDTIVSPKLGAILGPWKATEIYLNAGRGFHSNDARGTTITRDPATGQPADGVTPLVRANGAEIGVRSVIIPRLQTTVAVWRLDLASELVFVGDAGTTDVSRPSTRRGVEWSSYLRLSDSVSVDADLAWSRGRFSDADSAGAFIPGAAEWVGAMGLTADRPTGVFGSLRLRYFGPRALVEDNTSRSKSTSLVNAQVGYHLSPQVHVVMDVFNLLNSRASDIDYRYRSRLPGEPEEGVEGLHTHPALPRSMRILVRMRF
jgi:TonB dependent receptor/Carboxypeptidase regulatory-like domain/TonB-dependent Receptor Plug Domain